MTKLYLLTMHFRLRGFLSFLPISIKFGSSYVKYRYLSNLHLLLVNKLGYSKYKRKIREKFKHNFPPIRNKSELSKFNQNYINYLADGKNLFITSGGTTGMPSGFYTPTNYYKKFAAFRHSLWMQWGYIPNKPSILLNYSFSPELIRFNWRENGIDVNILEIETALLKFLDFFLKYQPKYLIGYPSTVMRLIEHLNEDSVKIFSSLEMIILGSEKLYSYQKSRISNYFNVPIYSWYGSSECVGMAFQCKKSSHYHFLPNIGYINEANGLEEVKVDSRGVELKLTGLTNQLTNFNGWETGDLYTGYTEECSSCGFKGQSVFDIQGRSQDFIIAKDGSYIYASDLNTHTLDLSNFAFYQILQSSPGEITIYYKYIDKSNKNLSVLSAYFDSKIGNLFNINFEIREDMLKTPRGKSPFIYRIIT